MTGPKPPVLPAAVIALWTLLAGLAPFLALHPHEVELTRVLAGPQLDTQPGAWLGYDDLGRPILDRLVLGARTSWVVAVGAVSLTLVLGSLIGALSGYLGGVFDHITVRVIDVFLAFPGILLAIALAGLLGPGIDNVIVALAAVGWVGFARLARAQVLSLKHREHVQCAVAQGARTTRILLRHLLPLASAPLIVEATFGIASAAVAEAGLSFLGLGVQPPAASWGAMVRDGARYMLVAPHMVLAPGLALMLVVLSANLLGDRVRDWMDVRRSDRCH
jgi:peptide/nickel transport system permease protein